VIYICFKSVSLYANLFKPLADKLIALGLLLISSPVLLLVIILLAISNKGSVWFVQARPGYRERIFQVIKFRTMVDVRDSNGNLLPDEVRLTSIGKFIRKTSLDELPQLINVLKGDMSIVGPRPLLLEYIPLYNERQRMRHQVKPGITGWAQVNGRNAVSWPVRLEMDAWYVENISFGLDLKILFLTLIKVIKAEGISSGTSATMEKFSGAE
jgi:lipopolysaccharide/colanic/teichoic acid biosynthesis glycosyltransferase